MTGVAVSLAFTDATQMEDAAYALVDKTSPHYRALEQALGTVEFSELQRQLLLALASPSLKPYMKGEASFSNAVCHAFWEPFRKLGMKCTSLSAYGFKENDKQGLIGNIAAIETNIHNYRTILDLYDDPKPRAELTEIFENTKQGEHSAGSTLDYIEYVFLPAVKKHLAREMDVPLADLNEKMEEAQQNITSIQTLDFFYPIDTEAWHTGAQGTEIIEVVQNEPAVKVA